MHNNLDQLPYKHFNILFNFDGCPFYMLKFNQSLIKAFTLAVLIGTGSIFIGYLLDTNLTKITKHLSSPKNAIYSNQPALNTIGGTKSPQKEIIAPEAFTGRNIHRKEVTSDDYMMVTAHPAASWVGAQVLKDGGSALDAVIAAQMVLNLVEPQSSGIGGGGFLLHWDVENKEISAYDGRETAPLGIDLKFFFHANGKPKKFMEAVIGGASIGVPGLIRMFDLARRDQVAKGKKNAPLDRLLNPAIELAKEGFPVSPRLHKLLSNDTYFTPGMTAYNYFYGSDGQLPKIGETLKNPDFALSLESLLTNGLDSFYTGPLAEKIIQAVQTAPGNPGSMTMEDMALYTALNRPATCTSYRTKHHICGMPPPSSGGITVAQIMGILEATNIDAMTPHSADAIQLFAEAMKLSFADRGEYIADSDFVDIPTKAMLNKTYLQVRALEMDLTKEKKEKAVAGHPSEDHANLYEPDNSIELPSTTHLVAIDKDGNAASITTSIETAFGSHQMVGGFLLNNQLTDFSKNAYKDGQPIANKIEPGKRPRSSMAPTIVLDEDNELKLLTGSPGGSRIIGYVAQSLIAMLDWNLSAQDAANMPRYLHRNWKLELEKDTHTPELIADMKSRGYDLKLPEMTSGLHIIERISNSEFHAGVDPRREGQAYGDDNLPDDIKDAFNLLFQ